MSGNALRSSAKPSRNKVTSSLTAHFSQMPTSIICFGTPALLTDSRTNIHADGMRALTWNSCGQVIHTGRRLGSPRRSPQSCMASWRVLQARVLIHGPLPQHLGVDDFGVVIPVFRRLPVAVLCHRFISTIAGAKEENGATARL